MLAGPGYKNFPGKWERGYLQSPPRDHNDRLQTGLGITPPPPAGSSLGKEWRWLSTQERLFPRAPAGRGPGCGEGAQSLHANWREAALPPGHFHPVFPDFSLSQPLGLLTFATPPGKDSCPDPTQVISATLQAPGLGPP